MLSNVCRIALLSVLAVGITATASTASDAQSSKVTDPHFELAPGYLQPEELPDSLELLGPPPAGDSASMARDEDARSGTLPLRGKPRWDLARLDADLNFPQPAKTFSCAMGIDIDEQNTPHLYRLMQRVLTDAGLSTYRVKNAFNRTRPFVVHNEGTCFAEQEPLLRNDGSYPSGHTAAGWAWALVLTEVNPGSTDALLKRGMEFGQSRVICNAHWQSDVDAGRIMGAATVARLHANAEFVSDVEAARKEVDAVKAGGPSSQPSCAAEEAALSSR